MGSKTATADRNRQREANTAQLMQNIMTGGEISKKREAELQKAADYGRGIQFLPGSPTVKGLTQAGGKPVFKTGATAADYTGRFTASPPTIGEFFGDAGRALFGGKASTPSFAQSTKVNAPSSVAGPNAINYAGFLPTPRESRGIIPALAEKVLVPGGITLGIAKDLFSRFFPGQEEEEQGTVNRGFAPEGFTFPADVPQRSIEETAGPTVDLRSPTIEEFITTPVSESGDFTRPEAQPNIIAETAEIPYEPKPNIFGLTDEGTYEVGPNLAGVGPEMGIFNNPFDRSSGYTPGLQTYRDNLIAQGISPEQADQMTLNLSAYGYKDGGLTDTIAPDRGPMSEGVASLFKNK